VKTISVELTQSEFNELKGVRMLDFSRAGLTESRYAGVLLAAAVKLQGTSMQFEEFGSFLRNHEASA